MFAWSLLKLPLVTKVQSLPFHCSKLSAKVFHFTKHNTHSTLFLFFFLFSNFSLWKTYLCKFHLILHLYGETHTKNINYPFFCTQLSSISIESDEEDFFGKCIQLTTCWTWYIFFSLFYRIKYSQTFITNSKFLLQLTFYYKNVWQNFFSQIFLNVKAFHSQLNQAKIYWKTLNLITVASTMVMLLIRPKATREQHDSGKFMVVL